MYFAISGTSCVGKSSFLRRLKSEGFPVAVGDYYEDQLVDPRFKSKAENVFVDLVYQAKLFSRNLPTSCIVDRFPTDNILYRLIFDVIDGKVLYSDLEKEVQWLAGHIMDIKQRWDGVVCIAKNPEATLEMMKKRKNNIDLICLNYINLQNIVFTMFAKEMGYPLIQVDDYINYDEMRQRVVAFINQRWDVDLMEFKKLADDEPRIPMDDLEIDVDDLELGADARNFKKNEDYTDL